MNKAITKHTERKSIGFMEGGRFRKGIKLQSKNGTEYPKEVDYFVFKEKEGLESKGYAEKIAELFGDKPKRLKIFFPPNDISEIWSTGYEAYANKAVIAMSDGEVIQYLVDNEANKILVYDGVLQEGENLPESLSHLKVEGSTVYFNAKANKGKGDVVGYTAGTKRKEIYMSPVSRLRFMLDGIMEPVYFMLITQIKRDRDTLRSQLDAIITMAEMTGRPNLGGIKADLYRIKGQKTHYADGKKMTSDSWYVHLSVSREWFEVAMETIQANALKAPSQEQLTAPAEEEPQDIIDGDVVEVTIDGTEFMDDAVDAEETAVVIDAAVYRTYVNKIGMDDTLANDILKSNHGSFADALDILKEQHTPPRE